MSTSEDVQYIGVFNRNWKDFIKLLPHMYHDTLRCTEHPPMYSWYPPHSSWIPPMYWTSPDVLMISPDVLMVSPDVLNTPRCTEHPPMYWTHIIQGVNVFFRRGFVRSSCLVGITKSILEGDCLFHALIMSICWGSILAGKTRWRFGK